VLTGKSARLSCLRSAANSIRGLEKSLCYAERPALPVREHSGACPMAARRTYRFGIFETDLTEGRLRRQGEPVRLQEQPFQVLIALLERHGELVTRDELRKRLWPGDTFVEFDKSVGVALAKLRAALGDDAANPRFVETVPRRGYRFIAPVTVQDDHLESGPAAPVGASMPPGRPSAPPGGFVESVQPRPSRRSNGWLHAAAALVVLGIVAAAALYWRSRAPSATPASMSIVIAQFANSTGDAAFDGSLRRATSVALRQSPFLNVTTDANIDEALQDLGRAPGEAISPGLARDVCRHLHKASVIEGSVARDDAAYVVVVSARRCGDGVLLARERQTAATKDTVLPALGRALERVRAMLGESRDTLTAYDRPLQVATTDSIDALRAFELGMELRTRADNVRAVPALKTAVAIDPQFALAYAQLGSAYSNTGDTTNATPYLRKAFELRDRATEPERLYITGRYFDIVTGELEKGAETYRLWTRMYPGEWLAFNALANDANLMGRYQIAADAAARAVELEPRQIFGQTNLLAALLGLNRFDEAKAVAGRMLERDPDNSSAHTARYGIADFLGDTAARDRELAWSRTAADGSGVIYVEAEAAAQHGRFAESTRLFQDVVRASRALHNDAAAANTLSALASYDALAGLDGPARQVVDASLALARTDTSVGVAAVVNGLLRRAHDTQTQLEGFDLDRPLSTLNIGVFAPTARMALALDGPVTADEVTRRLALTEPYELGQEAGLLPVIVRGRAYLAARAPALAAAEFQKILDHAGVDPVSPIYSLAFVGLARADAALGKRDDSRKAYAAFLDLWKGADRDVPILRAALREYATVQ
jgi:eukaryotic-like serine/threonine-protein kinase